METQKFDVHWLLDQNEIRSWMKEESERMGDWLDSFEISWTHMGDEEVYRLELSSEMNQELRRRTPIENCRFGKILGIAYIKDNTGECFPTIRAEGNALYYALRKAFKIKRNLSRK